MRKVQTVPLNYSQPIPKWSLLIQWKCVTKMKHQAFNEKWCERKNWR